MSVVVTEHIAASPEIVWDVMVDIDRWPSWTQSVRTAERLDDGPLAIGSRARLKQPGMPPMVWEVFECVAPSVFTWRTRTPGVTTVGIHRVEAGPGGDSTITLEVHHSGPLAGVVGALTASRTNRFMGMEAAGLKKASEERAAT